MKRIVSILCAALLLIGLTACGGGGKGGSDISIDVSALADELLKTVTSDSLSQTASEMVPSIYGFNAEDAAESIAYASSGATASEIAVVQSKESSGTEEIEKLFQARVDSQSALYATYNEAEVARLDTAIIKSAGSYTVLCVCDDTDQAEEILKKYGF